MSEINEVKLNGETLLSTRSNTVTEDTLVQGETAQNKAGESIVGRLDPVDKDKAYLISDEIGEIDNADYMPFYDTSEQKKKKTLFGSIVEKLKSVFAQKTDLKAHTYETDTEIPANADLNNYTTVGVYQCLLDATAQTISNTPYSDTQRTAFKLIVLALRKSQNIMQIFIPYISNHYGMAGKIAYRTYDSSWGQWNHIASTEAVHYLAQPDLARQITANEDLNDYTESGTYQCNNANIATTLLNCPVTQSFKLVVDRAYLDTRSEITQRITCQNATELDWYRTKKYNATTWGAWKQLGIKYEELNQSFSNVISNIDLNSFLKVGFYSWSATNASTITNRPTSGSESGLLYVFATWYNDNLHYKQIVFMRDSDDYYSRFTIDGSTWSDWKKLASTDDIAPSTVGNGYAVGTVSGSAITATISGFKLRAGVIVAIRLGSGLPANCTLNISNTGVKDIYYWGDNAIREMDVFNGSSIYTFMYDGTRYRLLSWSLVPTIFDQNYVADTSGNIGLTVGYNVNAFQIKNSIDSKKLVWNYYKNSAWRGDVKIADFDDLVHQSLGISIPDNANLNDYTTNGIYNVSSNTKAVTITNIPVTRAGKLIVMRVAGNTYINQFYITYNNSSSDNDGIFRRSYTGSAWLAWRRLTSDNDVGASIAKTGKSILPIWSYNTNTITSNGITATFNPLTGEITVNGTATANTYIQCFSGKNIPNVSKLPKGSYTLSGCPTGGDYSKYRLAFNCSLGSWFDFGNGITFTLNSDADLNDDFFIHVASGQTVSNLVFKPMLRTAFTTADYEPCEDIHKGNCYVGTCTTAGATKDKVAYVDGYFVLRKGVRVAIKFSNTNTYSSTTASPITLNVNDTGAKNIWYNSTHSGAGNTGAYTTIYGVANLYYYFVYDGTYWVWDGRDVDNNTTYTNMTLGNGYGTCATAESTTAKVVTLANYNLLLGGYVSVKFTYAVPANATMNINSKGAKNIWYRGANITANVIKAGDLATFIYDGTRYQLIGVDRDNALTISYNYNDSAGTPNYVTRDSNILMPQLSYVRRGDIVQVACIIRFVSAKTYSAGSVLFSGLPSPPTGWVHCENGGVNFWYSGGGMHNRDSLTVTAGKAFCLGFTYIEA